MKLTVATSLAHTRAFSVGLAVAACAAAILMRLYNGDTMTGSEEGLALPPAGQWLPTGTADIAGGIVASAATMVLMLLLNKFYNIMRSMTSLYVAFFAMMQLAVPDVMTRLYTGSLVAVVVPACMLLLFSCYRNPDSTRRVYLIFLLLSTCTLTQYAFLPYIAAMFIGCWQMRIITRRSLAAMFMGLLTPWWILLGFGIIEPGDIQMPRFENIFSVIDPEDGLLLLVTVGLSTLTALACFVLNVFKTIAYNARTRAYNGSLTIMTLTTIAAMCVDYRNLPSYIPMLNFCAAMQAGHYFSTHRADKSIIAIAIIIAVYAALAACQTAI